MKALLLKDWYVLWKQTRFFLLFVLIFSLMPGTGYSIFAITYAGMLPFTAMAYDERSHWDALSAMLPYSVRDLVLSRYAVGWIGIAGAGLLSLLTSLVEQSLFPDRFDSSAPAFILLGIPTAVIFMALILPFMFRFGVEKARLALYIAIIALSAGLGVLTAASLSFSRGNLNLNLSLSALNWALPLLAVVLTICSVRLSMNFYRAHAA